jgi:hypothetical protein
MSHQHDESRRAQGSIPQTNFEGAGKTVVVATRGCNLKSGSWI